MHLAGRHPLAGAGFAQEEHGRVGRPHLLQLHADVQKGVALADDLER